MKKRIISLILCVVLIFTAMAGTFTTSADETATISVSAKSFKGTLEVNWSVEDASEIASYKADLFDSEGQLMMSKNTTETTVTFDVIEGDDYNLQIFAYDSNGTIVATSEEVAVSEAGEFIVTNDAASDTYSWSSTPSHITKTDGVSHKNEHNPDGLSFKWSDSGSNNMTLKTKNPIALNNANEAYVGVISFDDVASIPTFKFGLNGDCSGYTFSVVSISSLDGSVTVIRDVTSIIFTANSINYVIIDPTSLDKTIPTNTSFCMNYNGLVTDAYIDALGYTNDADTLIDRLISLDTKPFKITNDALSNSVNTWRPSGYAMETSQVTDRPVTEHNPDGISLALTDVKGVGGSTLQLKNTSVVSGKKAAYVAVISVPEGQETLLARFGGWYANSFKKVTVVTIYNSNGKVCVNDNVTSNTNVYFRENTVNYIILGLADNNIEQIPAKGTLIFAAWPSADYTIYLDALGYTNDSEALINSLNPTVLEPYFNITKGFGSNESIVNGPWNGSYTYNEFVTDRECTVHNPDGKSLLLGKGTAEWVNTFLNTGIGTSATGSASAAVVVISVDDSADIYRMRLYLNNTDYRFHVVSIDSENVGTVKYSQRYFEPKQNTVNYIIIPIAANNVSSVSSVKIWTDIPNTALTDWKYYFDSIGYTDDMYELIGNFISPTNTMYYNLDFGAYPVDYDNTVIDDIPYINGYKYNSIGDHILSYMDTSELQRRTLALYRTGDTNTDNEKNIIDLVRMKKYLVGAIELSESGKKAADITLDNEIKSDDLIAFRKLLLNDFRDMGYSPADMESLVDFTVEVESGRDIRVLQLSDPQIIESEQRRYDSRLGETWCERWSRNNKDEMYHKYFEHTIGNYKPDLIILTGDLVYGEFDDSGEAWLEFIQYMDSFKIPWAPVFGNHDNETKMGVDWQCEQLEDSEYCLFKQRTLTGNGNYTVGLKQDGKYKRVFFMLDSNGGSYNSDESMANGHTQKGRGLGQDQIEWFTNTSEKMRYAVPDLKFSAAYHIPNTTFHKVFQQYTSTNDFPINLDTLENKSETDFGYLPGDFVETWDSDESVWFALKNSGFDSIFVGHVHSISASVVYKGVRFQFGQKSSTYDSLNWFEADGTIVSATSHVEDGRTPIVGGTSIPVKSEDGSIATGELLLMYEGPVSAEE